MSPIDRSSSVDPAESPSDRADAELDRIRGGGIPTVAERRLKRIAGATNPFFTSNLTAKEYALAEASGLQPIAQVMGSSVVQHGSVYDQIGSVWGSDEIKTMSGPWNLARSRAFGRLGQEAQFAGADTVLGVQLSVTGTPDTDDAVEYMVFGTAVRDTAFHRRPEAPVAMCALSGQDFDQLRRVGGEPRGLVGHTTVISVKLETDSNALLNRHRWSSANVNGEIPEISAGLSRARKLALAQVRSQASAVDANNIVIATLSHSIKRHAQQLPGGAHNYFHVTMHVVGTAVRFGARKPYPGLPPAPMVALNLGT